MRCKDNNYESKWLIDPAIGEITFLSVDDDRIDLDDTELVWIEPLPSWVWYQDMADFAAGIGDEVQLRATCATREDGGERAKMDATNPRRLSGPPAHPDAS